MIINLPYGNNFFDHKALVKKIKSTGRNYIIQGQVACTLADHPKPNSLDVWLRTNYARYPDTKQAVNEVISNLLNTGDFELGTYKCPDSGRKCKGIQICQEGPNKGVSMRNRPSMITKAKETGEIISLADDLKAAATDALKKAATLLGVGLHLYNGDSSFHDRPILNHAGKIIWSISSELNDIMLSFVPRLQRTGSN